MITKNLLQLGLNPELSSELAIILLAILLLLKYLRVKRDKVPNISFIQIGSIQLFKGARF
jgi:hypothetical protein